MGISRSTGEAVQRRSVVVPLVRRLLRLYLCYFAAGFVWSLLLAQVRYRMYADHFRHLDNLEWLNHI